MIVFAPPGPAERRRILARLAGPASEVAPTLLGHVLLRRTGRRVLAARIVEAEAYLPTGDPGAHVFHGRTPRTAPLFGPPGSIYVYVIYGIYHCLNLAVDCEGVPGCVLVRAAELLEADDKDAIHYFVRRASSSRVEWRFGSPTIAVRPPYARTTARSGTVSAV